MKPPVKRVYFVQVIDPNGGEYGAEKTPVAVNRRYAFVATPDGHAEIPEVWRHNYPPKLFGFICEQPRNSQGDFEGFGWIKE